MQNREMSPAAGVTTRAQRPGRGLLYRWFTLILASTLLGLVSFGLLPALQKHPFFAPGAQVIIEHDIEAGAFYYTDVGKVPEAEAFIRGAGVGAGAEEREQ